MNAAQRREDAEGGVRVFMRGDSSPFILAPDLAEDFLAKWMDSLAPFYAGKNHWGEVVVIKLDEVVGVLVTSPEGRKAYNEDAASWE